MRANPYRDGKLHVGARKCDTCVFRSGNLMHLNEGRLADLVKSNLEADTALTCHETLPEWTDTPNAGAICRGFWDAYADAITALRLAQALDIVEEVEL